MKCRLIVKKQYELNLDDLVYDQGGTMVGSFTLLESPCEDRIYLIETSPEMIEKMKKDTKRYEFIEEIKEDTAEMVEEEPTK